MTCFCFTFLVPANPGSPGQTAVKRACVWLCCVAVLSYTVASIASVLRVFCTHFRSCEYFCRTVMPSAHLTANKITWKSASFGTTTQFFTGWMPFLPPNQQRQSTEGIYYNLYSSVQQQIQWKWPDQHKNYATFCSRFLPAGHTWTAGNDSEVNQ